MRSRLAFLLVASLLLASVVFAEDEGKAAEEVKKEKKSITKLQIGVKKRVEDCAMRSGKGDSLSMHYTVIMIFLSNTSKS